MVALRFPLLALFALLSIILTTAAAPMLEKRTSYVGFGSTFTRVTNKDSLPWYKPYTPTDVHKAAINNPTAYTCYHGNSDALPYVTSWKPFDALWATALPALRTHNSAAHNVLLRAKILQIARETTVDARLILAMILQESSGNLAVPCTGAAYANCGIMQAAPGSVPFDPADTAASIDRMIRNGLLGTPGEWPTGGPGYAWLLDGAEGAAWYGIGGGGRPYRSLRAYNSGKVVDLGNLDATGGAGTVSYVNDVANRLMGWDGSDRGCGY